MGPLHSKVQAWLLIAHADSVSAHVLLWRVRLWAAHASAWQPACKWQASPGWSQGLVRLQCLGPDPPWVQGRAWAWPWACARRHRTRTRPCPRRAPTRASSAPRCTHSPALPALRTLPALSLAPQDAYQALPPAGAYEGFISAQVHPLPRSAHFARPVSGPTGCIPGSTSDRRLQGLHQRPGACTCPARSARPVSETPQDAYQALPHSGAYMGFISAQARALACSACSARFVSGAAGRVPGPALAGRLQGLHQCMSVHGCTRSLALPALPALSQALLQAHPPLMPGLHMHALHGWNLTLDRPGV